MLFYGLPSMEEKGGDGHADNQHEGSYPGEETQHQQEGAEDLRKDDQDQGPAVPDMEWVEKDVLLAAKMHHLRESVINTDQ